ncbi:MAG: hypothetical protein M3Q48_17960 [Actinomycetota bacterium]|jgi:hypothetical protein|nr:hypothetical protein [Actinomycetota bacterium]
MSETESTAATAEDEAAEVARSWVRAVMDERDLARAWPLTDPDLRLVLVQHWILSHEGDDVVGPPEGWDALAEGLAACPPQHPAWDRFAQERLRRWREFWTGFSAVTWGLRHVRASNRPDVWVVTFVEPRGKLMSLKPGPPLEFRHLSVRRREEGFHVAGLDGGALFKPGWPPTPG